MCNWYATSVNMLVSNVHSEFHTWKNTWNTWIFTSDISRVKFHMCIVQSRVIFQMSNFTCEKSREKYTVKSFTCKTHIDDACVSHVKIWKLSHVKHKGFEKHTPPTFQLKKFIFIWNATFSYVYPWWAHMCETCERKGVLTVHMRVGWTWFVYVFHMWSSKKRKHWYTDTCVCVSRVFRVFFTCVFWIFLYYKELDVV